MNRRELIRLLQQHPRTQIIGPNTVGKDYFTGNLCGHYSALQHALKRNKFNPQQDRLFCAGNLINYGQQGQQIMALLGEPWFYSVLGLHELVARYAEQSGQWLHWQTAGGDWAFDEQLQLLPRVAKYMRNLRKLPVTMIIQLKHSRVGLLSGSPGNISDWQEFETMPAGMMLECLLGEELSMRKIEKITPLEAIIIGNRPAQEPWAKGNVVGINTSEQVQGEPRKITLYKGKTLFKLIERRAPFKPVN